MATVGERLAELTASTRDNRERINELHDDIHGGPSVVWAQSIRGRLHAMQSAIEAADKLADAARELAREQERSRKTRIKTWQWSVIAACSFLTAVAPYALLLAGR